MAPATKERVDVILGWLANQGPQTVLLFLILCGGGYVATKMVPEHLRQIQDGYERIEDRQTEQLRAMNADRTEERAWMREALEANRRSAKAETANR